MQGELVDGVLHCPKCKSPMNITKARRRYAKKHGEQQWERVCHWGTQVVAGECACGKYVYYHVYAPKN